MPEQFQKRTTSLNFQQPILVSALTSLFEQSSDYQLDMSRTKTIVTIMAPIPAYSLKTLRLAHRASRFHQLDRIVNYLI